MQNGSSSKTIQTTGELRAFLANLLVQVQDGSVDLDTARVQSKIAAQINGSFYTEVKIAQATMEADEKPVSMGALPLAEAACPETAL